MSLSTSNSNRKRKIISVLDTIDDDEIGFDLKKAQKSDTEIDKPIVSSMPNINIDDDFNRGIKDSTSSNEILIESANKSSHTEEPVTVKNNPLPIKRTHSQNEKPIIKNSNMLSKSTTGSQSGEPVDFNQNMFHIKLYETFKEKDPLKKAVDYFLERHNNEGWEFIQVMRTEFSKTTKISKSSCIKYLFKLNELGLLKHYKGPGIRSNGRVTDEVNYWKLSEAFKN